MPSLAWARLRRSLAARGFAPATGLPEASEGEAAQATIQPARLVETDRLEIFPVGEPEPWPEPVAFLDGIQRMEVVAYAGASPIVAAQIAAGIQERESRRFRTRCREWRRLLVARGPVLGAADLEAAGLELVPLPEDDQPHPIRDLVLARRAVDAARGRLEREVGHEYRRKSDRWLVVDGSLAESPQWAADARMVGVVKSHATLPFDGEDLTRYLSLAAGSRSSVFAPSGRRLAAVYSWGLRLWPWEGKDLLHGLIRLEVAPSPESVAAADRISRWLLAERAPLSTPDPRWDRLLYGIHRVEQALRAAVSSEQ